MIKYILTFIIFSFLGWVYEKTLSLFTKKQTCDTLLYAIFNRCVPFLTIYGLGGIILVILFNTLQCGIIMKSIISTLFISMMECIFGQLSLRYNKYHTWQYPKEYIPTCDGYISVGTSLIWFILCIGFLKLIDISSFYK
jgi:uncharacterized membrane protein